MLSTAVIAEPIAGGKSGTNFSLSHTIQTLKSGLISAAFLSISSQGSFRLSSRALLWRDIFLLASMENTSAIRWHHKN
jgi:hypothetical protein